MTEVVLARTSERSGITRAALLWCTNSKDTTPIFEALAQLVGMSSDDRRRQQTHLLEAIAPHWEGQEALYVRLLGLRDTELALALLGSSNPINMTIGELEIGQADWWLEWLMDEENTDMGYWFQFQMASLFATRLNAAARQPFVTEFNKPDSPFRNLLAHVVLPHFPDLSTDIFAEPTISFLLADLNRARSWDGLNEPLLGTTATELFVTERLLPLLPDAKPPLSVNLREVLRQAGSRHGRRYLTS